MELTINECLTNGFIENLKKDNKIAAFILGALDSGFTVSMPGVIIAKRSKLEIWCHQSGQKEVQFWLRDKQYFSRPLADFFWCDVSVIQGSVYYDDIFICKTTIKN